VALCQVLYAQLKRGYIGKELRASHLQWDVGYSRHFVETANESLQYLKPREYYRAYVKKPSDSLLMSAACGTLSVIPLTVITVLGAVVGGRRTPQQALLVSWRTFHLFCEKNAATNFGSLATECSSSIGIDTWMFKSDPQCRIPTAPHFGSIRASKVNPNK
jgi:hypothetical protein